MVKTAVILAAGMGSRIRALTGDEPKGFLKIDGKTLIEHSINKLLESGIQQILIGTGYKKESYERLALTYPQIKCVYNPNYETTGSMTTLYQLKNDIKGDFLLLESDLMYEKKAIHMLLTCSQQDVILASKLTNSCDEVFIEVDKHHHLVNMSKNRDDLKNVYAELLGMTKLSYETFQKICSNVDITEQIDYEDGLVAIADQVNVFVQKEHDVVWCEVDDETHWQRAVQFIYPLIKAREQVKGNVKRNILLNPGPATTTDTVKYAQVVPDICPREQKFGDIMEFISTELTKFVANEQEYTTILFSGSGTAAVESILSSCVDQEAILIINNGAYGKRMCKIAKIYGLQFIEYVSSVDQKIDMDALETLIEQSPINISHLALVHCETTTGLLNNLNEIGALCKKYNLHMIVDAMSSYGAIPINMDVMNISYLAASANKSVQGMAGVSFVIAKNEHLQLIKDIPPRNLYLHLYEQYDYFKKTKQMRFTPPVQTLYALKQAIIELKWESTEARYERYQKSWETLIQGLDRLGLHYLVNQKDHSKIITAIKEPHYPQYEFNEMHQFFYERGFTIYPGKIDHMTTFRIANIGQITAADMNNFISLLEQYINRLKGG